MAVSYAKIDQWILAEDAPDLEHLGKCEAVMCLGNGYMGLRSAMDERYLGETRNLLINGTFDRFDESEVTELPNAADVTAVELWVNGVRFSLDQGAWSDYSRELNIKTGELTRQVAWTSPKGDKVWLEFHRIVSLKRLHDIAMQISVTPLSGAITLKIRSGIDARVTNTGCQHFTEGEKRFYDKKYLQLVETTIQSGIDFVLNATHTFYRNGEPDELATDVNLDRRVIYADYTVALAKNETFTVEKFANVNTTRDADRTGLSLSELQALSLEELKASATLGYQALAEESAVQWNAEVWDAAPIEIQGDADRQLDLFAVRFAQYHMRLMVPSHDNRMNIGAKALSGEGYKGHCFWDTEIFLLPYYIFTDPAAARKLEEYRYLSLPGAHRKAAENGYQGAMFPWESAWLDDGETCPAYMGTDIVTGAPIKVWSGIIEQHITADVAFGAWQYAVITGDQEFMDKYGYELIMDAAIFWASRLEEGTDGRYHINDVVGPDEYHEHVNDNAFTNYMARWNLQKAMEYHDLLKSEKPELFNALAEKLELAAWYPRWADGAECMFLPQPTAEGVLPMDDRFMTLKEIDLSKYKNQEFVAGIMKDYNLEQIQGIQVCKQADCLVLFYLLEDLFSPEVKKGTFDYYEYRTLHDSSLSLSTHSVQASDLGRGDLAYDLFRKAAMIDLGPYMGSSDAGIHAASFGGVWQCVVYGFGGARMLGGKLRIAPKLPKSWDKLSYTLLWKGQKLAVTATQTGVTVENLTRTASVEVEINGETCSIAETAVTAKI
uniref:glycoside hydrolase family 65 protein n=1 Tax=Enterocloster clostridioformis TaxID=1531 RepID=UPI0025A6745C|nr:glycosyl hydrolase family 65 protein [Enterocloster clostridioformis]